LAKAVIIRPAEDRDIKPMQAIFNHEVEHTLSSWRWAPLNDEEWQGWFEEHTTDPYALLTAEVDGQVAGFAGYSSFRSPAGYDTTVENSVYLSEDFRGMGLGRRLLKELMSVARDKDIHAMIAAITVTNERSIRLHQGLGFVEVGRLPQVGAKFDRWLDLTLLEVLLNHNPQP
jgi:phosphinothricin acetyltransferase